MVVGIFAKKKHEDTYFMFQTDFMVTRADTEKALHNTVPSTQRGSDILVDHRPVHWENIGGLENVKQQLKQACIS